MADGDDFPDEEKKGNNELDDFFVPDDLLKDPAIPENIKQFIRM